MTPLYRYVTTSPSETLKLGQTFGTLLQEGDFVSLQGDLGAGKTLFVKGVAQSLGCDPDDVISPSFTLVQQYHGRVSVHHLDIYRLNDPEEDLFDIGYEEFFHPMDAVTLVEWGDRAQSLFPDARFEVLIEKREGHGDHHGDHREVTLFAIGQRAERIDAMKAVLTTLDGGAHDGTGDSS